MTSKVKKGKKKKGKKSSAVSNKASAASKNVDQSGVNLNLDDADEQTTQDLTEFVQSLLQKMHGRFQEMSDSIINRC